jgi:hypothetical protein
MRPRPVFTAIVMTFALLSAVATILSDYISDGLIIPIFTAVISFALFIWSAFLHRRAILHLGAMPAISWLLVWLGVFMVIVPNFAMTLLLYGEGLGAVVAPIAMLMFLFGSLYYLLPSEIFGAQFFLQETVISPTGIAGILVSMLFWAAVVAVAVGALHLIAGKQRHRHI